MGLIHGFLRLYFSNRDEYLSNVGFGIEELTNDLDTILLFETWEHDTQWIQGLGNYNVHL